MLINFSKMHGAMNDFVVFHDPGEKAVLSSTQAALLCNRRLGVGADGVIVVRPSQAADFFMDYMNSDGSLAEMCGNGIRCLAKYTYDNGLTSLHRLAIETRAGIKVVEMFEGPDGTIDQVKVNMGPPAFAPEDIPVHVHTATVPIVDYRVEVQDRVFYASMVSMGNPHCVIVMSSEIDSLPSLYGPDLESHSLFPAKANVEFVKIIDRKTILLRVWERGCGETFACGTGACAAAVVTRLKGLTDSPVRVRLLGGDLTIDWKGQDADVFMTGPASWVYHGTITI